MWQQLIWIEAILKGTVGLLLLLAPGTLARVLGLPRPETGFWPRLLGSSLLALTAAYLVEGFAAGRTQGLGLGGSVAVNLAAAPLIAAVTLMAAPQLTRRGKALLWLLAILVAVLGLVELAYV